MPAYREPEFLPWDGRRVPITFVGGYLGAGKTTAINDLLASTDRPIAVIVNDVGAVNIDARLIRQRHGDTIELTNGCVCCSSLDDMGAAFDLIRARPVPPDHVVIELSGVADVCQMLPWGQTAGFLLDGVVVVVAADQFSSAVPDWVQHHMEAQIVAADLLILTKTDVADAVVTQSARVRLEELAPDTPVFDARRDLVGAVAVGRFLALGGRRPGGVSLVADSTLFDAHEVQLLAVPDGLTRDALRDWVLGLGARLGAQVVRAKGMVMTSDTGLVLVQLVGRRCEMSPVPVPERGEPTGLVVISLKLLV